MSGARYPAYSSCIRRLSKLAWSRLSRSRCWSSICCAPEASWPNDSSWATSASILTISASCSATCRAASSTCSSRLFRSMQSTLQLGRRVIRSRYCVCLGSLRRLSRFASRRRCSSRSLDSTSLAKVVSRPSSSSLSIKERCLSISDRLSRTRKSWSLRSVSSEFRVTGGLTSPREL
jgi:hypothetical protein